MIVRLMGEGQFRVGDGEVSELNELDNAAVAALEGGDEDSFRRSLGQLHDAVRRVGARLDDADLSPSDLIIPPPDLSLEEARELFSDEGLIPDLPA